MSITTKAANAYKLFKSGKAARDYYRLAKNALDEDTRTGGLFKLGLKATELAAQKALGSSISSHPYFAYHKVHFEVLADALNAVTQKDFAADALKRAVAAADSTAHVTLTLNAMRHRREGLFLYWLLALSGTIDLRNRVRREGSAALSALRGAGYSEASLESGVASSLEEWRALWAELTRDAFDLLIMVDAETRIAEEAIRRYDTKVEQLKKGSSSMQRIAGHASEKDRQWAIFDRMTGKQTGSALAVQDPTLYARRQRDLADKAASQLADALDIIMTNIVDTPDVMMKQLDEVFLKKRG